MIIDRSWITRELTAILGHADDYTVDFILTFSKPAQLREFLTGFVELSARNQVEVFVQRMFQHEHQFTPDDEPKIEDTIIVRQTSTQKPRRRETVRVNGVKRRICRCQAKDHDYLGLCFVCGKIVCDEEGAGPCLFCGAFWIGEGAAADSETVSLRTASELTEGYQQAVEMTERLVKYDREAERRMQVLDMETDFYAESVNPWITDEQREYANARAQEKKQITEFGHREDMQLKLDFKKKQIEVESLQKQREQEIDDQVEQFLAYERDWNKFSVAKSSIKGPGVEIYKAAVAELRRTPLLDHKSNKLKTEKNELQKLDDSSCSSDDEVDDNIKSRPVDIEFCSSIFLDENQDQGMCLSLHQPWASLLVHGFKRLEGRSWDTSYRGRLWIHAASKEPEPVAIKELANYYASTVYENDHPALPEFWPVSAILGCVDLLDCVKKSPDERFPSFINPKEDNDSEYRFVCKAPRVLAIPVPMSGQHKLWKIPKPKLQVLQTLIKPYCWSVPLGETPVPPPTTSSQETGDDLWSSVLSTPTLRVSLSVEIESPISGLVILRRFLTRDLGLDFDSKQVDYWHDWKLAYGAGGRWIRCNSEPIPVVFQTLFHEALKLVPNTFPVLRSVGGPHIPKPDAMRVAVKTKCLDPLQGGDPSMLISLEISKLAVEIGTPPSVSLLVRWYICLQKVMPIDLKQGEAVIVTRCNRVVLSRDPGSFILLMANCWSLNS